VKAPHLSVLQETPFSNIQNISMSAGSSGAIGQMNTWGGSLLGVCYSSEFSKPE